MVGPRSNLGNLSRSPVDSETNVVGGYDNGAEIVAMQREIKKLAAERDLAIQQGREWQLRVASLKAELDKERGSVERVVEGKTADKERELRLEAQSEWAKSEAAWRERIRNERLLRLSYERVLMNLGFAPSRIASDLVRVSRPQPLPTDPGGYQTANLLDIESAMVSQPGSRKRGLFAYSIEEIKGGMGVGGFLIPKAAPATVSINIEEEIFRPSSGKRELLKSLASAALN